MKKYAPRKVFILENGEYVELTYEEFESRKENDPTYEDRYFIPVQGFLMEVSKEHYKDFYRAKEREAYLKKLNAKYGLLSIDAFDNEDDNGTDYIQAETEDVAETVTHLLMLDKLRSVIPMLSEIEQELIQALFFKGLTEREYAKECGVSQVAIHMPSSTASLLPSQMRATNSTAIPGGKISKPVKSIGTELRTGVPEAPTI